MTIRSALVGLLTAPALVVALTGAATALAPGGTDGDAAAPPAPTTVKVTDPRRDAEGNDARVRRLAEITKVRYRWVPGSDRLRIATSFARLQRGGVAARSTSTSGSSPRPPAAARTAGP